MAARRMLTGALLVTTWLATPHGQLPTIEDDVLVAADADACEVTRAAQRLLAVARQPAGLELLPAVCGSGVTLRRSGSSLNLRGLTLAEALDQLVTLAPAYGWRNVGGVAVMAPVALSRSRTHFLNRPLGDFVVRDANIGSALLELQTRIGPWDVRGAMMPVPSSVDSQRPITVTVPGATGYAALNGIVRAHGHLVWKVSYCRPEARAEFARIAFDTFDGSGVSGREMGTGPQGGGSADACAAQ